MGAAIGISQCGSNIGQLVFAVLIPWLLGNSEVFVSQEFLQKWMWKWCPWMLVSWCIAIFSFTSIPCAFMIQPLESKKVLKKDRSLKSLFLDAKFLTQEQKYVFYCFSGLFSYMGSFIPLFLLAKSGLSPKDVSWLIFFYGMYYLWIILRIIKVCSKYRISLNNFLP